MTPAQAHQKFAKIVDQEGRVLVAARLGCSVTQVIYIAQGKREPGLRIACAIEEVYEIPPQAWVEKPAAPKLD